MGIKTLSVVSFTIIVALAIMAWTVSQVAVRGTVTTPQGGVWVVVD